MKYFFFPFPGFLSPPNRHWLRAQESGDRGQGLIFTHLPWVRRKTDENEVTVMWRDGWETRLVDFNLENIWGANCWSEIEFPVGIHVCVGTLRSLVKSSIKKHQDDRFLENATSFPYEGVENYGPDCLNVWFWLSNGGAYSKSRMKLAKSDFAHFQIVQFLCECACLLVLASSTGMREQERSGFLTS